MSRAAKGSPSRREFLGSTALAAGSLLLPEGMHAVHAGVDDILRVGLVGCGGRGTGAAAQALHADPRTELVAMADAFADRLTSSLSHLQKGKDQARVKVLPEARFVGFDAYRKLIDSGVDVVILATPPHFRPAHLAAIVEKGLHAFVEKPVAVDAPGVRSILATCELAQSKNLSIVSGLCYRYQRAKQETFRRIHDGMIGDIVTMQCTYNTGGLWMHPRKPEWSDMEWQMRNWLYFTWLSGDHIAEQHIHSLDKLAWAMQNIYPVRATSTGGRQVRTEPEYGYVYDHFSTVYEWQNGVKGFSNCRQMQGCDRDVSDHIFGTLGTAHVMQHRIVGETSWRHHKVKGDRDNMYQNEHDALFASIRSGKPINNGDYMAKSTLMAIMGRMSAYTGKSITFDQVLHSKEDLTPTAYAWGDLPVPPVALPGKTKFL